MRKQKSLWGQKEKSGGKGIVSIEGCFDSAKNGLETRVRNGNK